MKQMLQKFIQEVILRVPSYQATPKELHLLKQERGITSFVYQKLTTQKFRSSTLNPIVVENTKKKIAYCLENKLPIHITVPFGGYKNCRLATFPHIDWSEVFNLLELRAYLTPIAAYYPYGVILEYFSDEILVSKLNNIPQQSLEKYNIEFQTLVWWFNQVLPKNFIMKFSRIRDQISEKEFWKRLEKGMPQVEEKWKKLSEHDRKIKLGKAKRNYYKESPTAKEIRTAAKYHEAFLLVDWDIGIPWAFDKHMIPIGFRYTNTWGIPIKSSRSSVTQFWVGTGAIVTNNNECIPTILTHEQHKEMLPNIQMHTISFFPQSFPSLQGIEVISNWCGGER